MTFYQITPSFLKSQELSVKTYEIIAVLRTIFSVAHGLAGISG